MQFWLSVIDGVMGIFVLGFALYTASIYRSARKYWKRAEAEYRRAEIEYEKAQVISGEMVKIAKELYKAGPWA